MVNNTSQAPDICENIDFQRILFRRCPSVRESFCFNIFVIVGELNCSEITQNRVEVVVKKYILRFDVAMYYIVLF
jgi:hypothetical protein